MNAVKHQAVQAHRQFLQGYAQHGDKSLLTGIAEIAAYITDMRRAFVGIDDGTSLRVLADRGFDYEAVRISFWDAFFASEEPDPVVFHARRRVVRGVAREIADPAVQSLVVVPIINPSLWYLGCIVVICDKAIRLDLQRTRLLKNLAYQATCILELRKHYMEQYTKNLQQFVGEDGKDA